MKSHLIRHLPIAVLTLASIAFTGCMVVEPARSSGRQSGVKSPGSTASQERSPGYNLGHGKGFEDGRGGLSRTPSRYDSLDSQADRADFFRGYESGYNEGIR